MQYALESVMYYALDAVMQYALDTLMQYALHTNAICIGCCKVCYMKLSIKLYHTKGGFMSISNSLSLCKKWLYDHKVIHSPFCKGGVIDDLAPSIYCVQVGRKYLQWH